MEETVHDITTKIRQIKKFMTYTDKYYVQGSSNLKKSRSNNRHTFFYSNISEFSAINTNSRATAASAGFRHHIGSRSRTGYVVKALEEVKIHGKRFSAYPDTGREAPDAEKSHHFYSTKRSLEEERKIPVIVKVTFLEDRMGHVTDVIPEIKEVVDIFKYGLFDPKKLSNSMYSNAKGVTIGSCLRAENSATGIVAGLNGFKDGALVTQLPVSIFFVTVLTMIESAGGKIQFYQ